MKLTRLNRSYLTLIGFIALAGAGYIFFAPINHNTISIITSIKQAKAVFEQATPEDLFVFDIDFTLLEPVDPIFQQRNTWPPALNGSLSSNQLALIPLFNDLFKTLKAQQAVEKMFKTFKNKPAEQETLSFINDLRARGVRVICLTARKGIEKSTTIKELHNFGIDLASSFPGVKPMTFDDLNHYSKTPLIAGDVCYDKGVLFAASVPKGIVLAHFFTTIDYRPARVFFFDDHRKNSESITRAMRQIGIPSHCFFYLARRVQPDAHFAINRVKKQFNYIKEHATFIGYEDAKNLAEIPAL